VVVAWYVTGTPVVVVAPPVLDVGAEDFDAGDEQAAKNVVSTNKVQTPANRYGRRCISPA
jgi:hypothetical protein